MNAFHFSEAAELLPTTGGDNSHAALQVAVFAVPTAFNSYGNENVTMRLGRGAAFAPDVIVKAAWLQPTRGWDQVAPHLGAGCPSRETDDKHLAAELKNLSMQNQAHGSYRQTS